MHAKVTAGANLSSTTNEGQPAGSLMHGDVVLPVELAASLDYGDRLIGWAYEASHWKLFVGQRFNQVDVPVGAYVGLTCLVIG